MNELENLALEADALPSLDTPQPGAEGAPEPEPAKLSNAEIIGGAITMARDVFCGFTGLQSPRQHLQPQAVQSLGDVWGAVCDKRGIDLSATLGEYGAEVAAVCVTLPIAIALNAAVRQEIAAREAKPIDPAEVSEVQPAAQKAAEVKEDAKFV